MAQADGSFEDFVGVITRCSKEIQRIKATQMRRWGLRGTDVMALYSLARNPEGVTSSELARLAGVDRAATSRTLAALERDGLVCVGRRAAADDTPGSRGYRAPVTLTGRGREVAGELMGVIDEFVAGAVRGVPASDRAAMYRALGAILSNLTAIAESEER